MRLFLIICLCYVPVFCGAQSQQEIISILQDYSENIGSGRHSHAYADDTLNPTLDEVRNILCEESDTLLFEEFLDMILRTGGISASEYPHWILGEIFLCNPDLVEERFNQKNIHPTLKESLDWGFQNVTYNKEAEIPNYSELKARVEILIK